MLRRKLVTKLIRGPKRFGFRGSYVDTANLTTYSFTAYIGQADAKRVVVCGFSSSNRIVNSCTINGVTATQATATAASNRSVELWYANVPSDEIVTVSVTWSGATANCALAVWSGYPTNVAPVDAVQTSSAGATTLTLTDLAKTTGGFVCLAAIGSATGVELSYSQNGMEQIIENVQSDVEATITFGAASVPAVIATTTADDFTLTLSPSSTCGFVGATWA